MIRDQVAPWIFMAIATPFRVKRFDGRPITYQGIGFSGSPQQVFWSGYIEPFLESVCVTEVEAAARAARDRGVDAREVLAEVEELVSAGIEKVYREMASVDLRLSRVESANATPRSVDGEVDRMSAFLSERVRAELAMWVPTSRFEQWHARNKFWVWAIPILISLLSVTISLKALIVASRRRDGERTVPRPPVTGTESAGRAAAKTPLKSR